MINLKLLVLTFSFAIFTAMTTDNWPNFRGANSNQLPAVQKLPSEWSNTKNLSWKYDLKGRGWSCPIVWGNKVFFTNAVLEDLSLLPSASGGGRSENPADAVYNFEV
jgi:hypothetical protein